MEMWIILFTLVFLLAGLGFVGWKLAQYFRRGWKDHLWIWQDANRAAIFLLIITGGQGVARWVWRGWNDEALAFLIAAAVTVPIPYIAYTIGRLLGMWHRSRHGTRLS